MRGSKGRLTPDQVERDRAALAVLNAPSHRARILGLIAVGHPIHHVVAIGEHHGSWTAEDVWTTLRTVGVRPPRPSPFGGAKPAPDARVVELTEVQWDVLREMCRGATPDQVASRLFLSRDVADRHQMAVVDALEAVDRAQALALVLTGKVRPVCPV